jgi:hypothetical protein
MQKQASQDVAKHVAAVFVATPDAKTIAGFCTLSAYAVSLGDLPPEVAKNLPFYPSTPATLLGRLAVSAAFQNRGLCVLTPRRSQTCFGAKPRGRVCRINRRRQGRKRSRFLSPPRFHAAPRAAESLILSNESHREALPFRIELITSVLRARDNPLVKSAFRCALAW